MTKYFYRFSFWAFEDNEVNILANTRYLTEEEFKNDCVWAYGKALFESEYSQIDCLYLDAINNMKQLGYELLEEECKFSPFGWYDFNDPGIWKDDVCDDTQMIIDNQNKNK